MFGFIRPERKNPMEDRYNMLRSAAGKAYRAGDVQRYKTLVAKANQTLIEMFSSGKNTGKRLSP